MKIDTWKGWVLTTLIIMTTSLTMAQVTMPKVFSNNMVLQRDQKVQIWGWAKNKEKVSINFNGQEVTTNAGKDGQWKVQLMPMKYGGPYIMTVKGESTSITLNNILIGDVWVCSGQSNMEWVLKNTNQASAEIAQSKLDQIRFFTVKQAMSFTPKNDFEGGEWLEANPNTSPDFSAVAYYFGKKINADIGVPIGLINSSWGGTNVETWTSSEVMSKIGGYKNLSEKEYNQIIVNAAESRKKYAEALKNDRGTVEKWYSKGTDYTKWETIEAPLEWSKTPIGGQTDGVVWFAKSFKLPVDFNGQSGKLSLGPIDDWDETYVNGQLVGQEFQWDTPRNYNLTSGILQPGINWVVVKITDNVGGGGFVGKPESLFVSTMGNEINLSGIWKYKPSTLSKDFNLVNMGPNEYPSQLYNAMIAPMTSMRIKGAIWYQGEANTDHPYTYRQLFPAMINNWRDKFDNQFPFLWVQLANFMSPESSPSESNWAELREAQNMTLSLKQTAQSVIIDIGDANDIHPRNKKDVGERLALGAEKIAYDQDVVFSGPVFEKQEIIGNTISLTFSQIGGGLMAKDQYGYLKGFAIAGEDQKFVWAQAKIEGNQIVVSSNVVQKPVAVRYAWANNPDDANLYNAEGLPASPFRTDQWHVPEM